MNLGEGGVSLAAHTQGKALGLWSRSARLIVLAGAQAARGTRSFMWRAGVPHSEAGCLFWQHWGAVGFGGSDLVFGAPRRKSSTTAQAGVGRAPGWRQKNHQMGLLSLKTSRCWIKGLRNRGSSRGQSVGGDACIPGWQSLKSTPGGLMQL